MKLIKATVMKSQDFGQTGFRIFPSPKKAGNDSGKIFNLLVTALKSNLITGCVKMWAIFSIRSRVIRRPLLPAIGAGVIVKFVFSTVRPFLVFPL